MCVCVLARMCTRDVSVYELSLCLLRIVLRDTIGTILTKRMKLLTSWSFANDRMNAMPQRYKPVCIRPVVLRTT